MDGAGTRPAVKSPGEDVDLPRSHLLTPPQGHIHLFLTRGRPIDGGNDGEPVQSRGESQVTWGWWLLLLTGVLSTVAGVIILFKLPRQPGPQPADALMSFEDLATIELTTPEQLEGDSIGDGPNRLHRVRCERGPVAQKRGAGAPKTGRDSGFPSPNGQRNIGRLAACSRTSAA